MAGNRNPIFTPNQKRILKRAYAARARAEAESQRNRMPLSISSTKIWCDGRSVRRLVKMNILDRAGSNSSMYVLSDEGWQFINDMAEIVTASP